MEHAFHGKRVLVTGSTRGIGRAAAEKFIAAGAEVILHGRSGEAVGRAARELGRRGLAADLQRRDEVRRLAALVGDLDVLVNCAGVYEEQPFAQTDERLWDKTIAINVTAPWILSRELLPGLARRKGVIVNIGSDSGLMGYANGIAYCASKGAIIGLTKAIAIECAPDVRVLCVCPGPVETDMMRDAVESQPDPEAARRQWEGFPLLRRVASAEEIAGAILAAASPAFSFATGSVIVVDGGTTAGRRV